MAKRYATIIRRPGQTAHVVISNRPYKGRSKEPSTGFQREPQQSAANAPLAWFDRGRGGVITETGKFFPTSNQSFLPTGYRRGLPPRINRGPTKDQIAKSDSGTVSYVNIRTGQPKPAPRSRKLAVKQFVKPYTGTKLTQTDIEREEQFTTFRRKRLPPAIDPRVQNIQATFERRRLDTERKAKLQELKREGQRLAPKFRQYQKQPTEQLYNELSPFVGETKQFQRKYRRSDKIAVARYDKESNQFIGLQKKQAELENIPNYKDEFPTKKREFELAQSKFLSFTNQPQIKKGRIEKASDLISGYNRAFLRSKAGVTYRKIFESAAWPFQMADTTAFIKSRQAKIKQEELIAERQALPDDTLKAKNIDTNINKLEREIELYQGGRDIIKGFGTYYKYKPTQAGLTFVGGGAFAGTLGVVGGVGARLAASGSAPLIGKSILNIQKLIVPGLTAAYGFGIATEYGSIKDKPKRREFIGESLAELTAFGAGAKVGSDVVKGFSASKVSDVIIKRLAKEKPSDIELNTKFARVETEFTKRGEKIISEGGDRFIDPEGFKQSDVKIINVDKLLTIGKSTSGRPTTLVITPKGKQTSTTLYKYGTEEYFIQSLSQPGKKTRIDVLKIPKGKKFLGAKRIGRYKVKASIPFQKFTEGEKILSSEKILGGDEFLSEIRKQVQLSKAIKVKASKGKFEPVSIIVRSMSEGFGVKTKPGKKAKLVEVGKPVYDFDTMSRYPEYIKVKEISTRYLFVEGEPKPQKQIIERLMSGETRIKTPARSEVKQVFDITERGFIKYVEKKQPNIFKSKRAELRPRQLIKERIAEIRRPRSQFAEASVDFNFKELFPRSILKPQLAVKRVGALSLIKELEIKKMSQVNKLNYQRMSRDLFNEIGSGLKSKPKKLTQRTGKTDLFTGSKLDTISTNTLKQELDQVLKPTPHFGGYEYPKFPTPKIPKFDIPRVPLIPKLPSFQQLYGGGSRSRGSRKRKKGDLFYTPDFTAKALGINIKPSKKQLKKILGDIYTGLEIRPGLLFK